jgi:hypothetical protein
VAAVPERSNGLAAAWVKPVVWDDDDFDALKDWSKSIADERAPSAGSISNLRQKPHGGVHLHGEEISKRRASAKSPVIYGFFGDRTR